MARSEVFQYIESLPYTITQKRNTIENSITGASLKSVKYKLSYSEPSLGYPYLLGRKPVTGPMYMEARDVLFGYEDFGWTGIFVPDKQVSYDKVIKPFLPGEPFYHKPNEDRVQQHAFISLTKAVNSALVELQGIVFLGEFKESLSLARGSWINAIGLTIKYVAKGKFLRHNYRYALKVLRDAYKHPGAYAKAAKRLAKRFYRQLKDLYFEYVFGVKPLLSDIDTLLKIAIPSSRSSRTVSVSSENKAYKSDLYDMGVAANFVKSKAQRVYESSYSIRYKARVGLTLPKLSAPRLGSTFDDFVPSVWELLPLSFVIDYFTNLGDIIGAQHFCSSKMIWSAGGSKTEFSSTEHRYGYLPSSPSVSVNVYGKPVSARIITSITQRVGLPDRVYLTDSFSFQLPGIQQALNTLLIALKG